MLINRCANRPILKPCGLENFNYQVDPYVGCAHYCHYCYALTEAETDWTEEILIHKDIAGQLNEELEKITPQKIYMGYHTDPYQPCEAEYSQTRNVLELLLEKGFSASILTKSDLFLRDIDLLQKMENASLSISVAFNDNHIRQKFEDNTINTEDRIEALSKLRKAGIKTSALICPIIPYLADLEPLIDQLASITDVIWIYGISINKRSDPSWKNIEVILNSYYSDLKDQIEEVVFSQDHQYWIQLRRKLLDIQKEKQLNLNINIAG